MIRSVIFDMDGVLIDSEHLWKKAEMEVFSSVGVRLSEELCQQTACMTTGEVTRFWYKKYPWKGITLEEIEQRVIHRVAQLINEWGTPIAGGEEFVRGLKSKGYKLGLATNSPSILIPAVLCRCNIEGCFDAIASAENESQGKPHPAVYLSVAGEMNVNPEQCLAIEDSVSGIMAAKKAGMKTILMADDIVVFEEGLVDYRMRTFSDINRLIFS
jgi:mannitol-1-/sugar-/sorbitol-6-/2-deoxyglucose-6-phosphatase